ncbi:MAG: bifunctional oligoribonuclease/PAP phosphatase NrnA [Candidatus Stahlbacteria bacterium]|nr:MAG: bifunctional oligoribonuclease/PAP phosphatase NrnA [Candidatus Stahlbacteria bacterium]
MKKAIDIIKKYNKFLIVSHKYPDGDSIGSQIALALGLLKIGKKAYIYNEDPPTDRYSRFKRINLIHTDKKDFDEEVIFSLDSAELNRIGFIKDEIDFTKPIINIDHHISNKNFGDINIVKPYYSSTAEIIYELLNRLTELDEEIATYLYIGILTDTGSFRYPNTTSHSLRVASKLVNYGVVASQISEFIWFTDPPARIKLLGDVLQNITLHDKFSIMYVTKNMLKNHGAKEEDTNEFVDYGLTIKNVKATAMIKEREGGILKVSLRSRNDVSVQELASEYGGGGHKTAAGFTYKGDLRVLKKELEKKLERIVN